MKYKIVESFGDVRKGGWVILKFNNWDNCTQGVLDDRVFMSKTDAAEYIRRKRKEQKYGKRRY